MGGLFGHGKSTSQADQRYAGIQLQTSAYAGVIPIVYGTARVAANLIYYTDFTPIPHTTTTQVGKGGGSQTQTYTTYTYTACLVMALSEGPVAGVNQVWKDQKVGSMALFGFTFFTGARAQTPWSYLVSNHPTYACGYSGLALCANATGDLGTGAQVGNHNFELVGLLATQQDPNAVTAYDAKPSDVVVDFLSNIYYGATWPASKISDLVSGNSSYQTYCTACGFVLSLACNSQKSGATWLKDIFNATNSESVYHSGSAGMTLNVVPYGDQSITANGVTYVPNSTPLYNLTYDDFLGVGGKHGSSAGASPVMISRISNQDVYNCIPIEYLDRSNAYHTSVIDVPEPTDIAVNGLKRASPLSLHMITRIAMAQAISLIQAQKAVYIRNQYTFKLGWRYFLLEPMDLVTLTDPILGLNQKVVRIVSIDIPDEGSEENGITITAEEWPFGVATATAYNTQTPSGLVPNVNADPGPAATPLIFNSPSLWALNRDIPELVLLAAGGSIWGGCEVWVSSTGTSYAKAGYVDNPCRFGTLTAGLAAWSGGTTQDTTNTLSVTMPNGGVLSSVDNATAAAGLNLIWVDGEMISFQTATLTGTNAYNLTGLYRGLFGTNPGAHSIGASWGKCDEFAFRYPVNLSQVGSTVYVKLVSYNIWGGGKRQISAETAYTFSPAQLGLPIPGNVTIQVGSTSFL